MKVFDCITYFNEPMLFEVRLNILDKYVDEFIVAEANFTHSGYRKKINFNKDLYPKFKNRIKHLIIENEPNNIVSTEKNENENFNKSIYRLNAAKRIEFQRNALSKAFKCVNQDDWIIYSDSDEIPNLENINLNGIDEKIILFKQDMFYYKFNLVIPNFKWSGTKGVKKKNLKSPQWLRNVKDRKYAFYRLDTFFSEKKYTNIKIIPDGGWHFSNIKNAEMIEHKLKSYLHHREFDQVSLSVDEINNLIKKKQAIYDLRVDKKVNKVGNGVVLNAFNINGLPKYINQNLDKYKKWLD